MVYSLLTGPLFYFSLLVFAAGLIVQAVRYIRGLDWKLDRVAYTAHPIPGIKGAARSIFYWLIPFGTRSWRAHPFMTIVFFVFHAGVVAIPLFLLAHTIILKDALGIAPPAMPQAISDILSWGVIVSGLFLFLRRIALPEVRILSTAHDYLVLALTILPFATGLVCRYKIAGYDLWLCLHIISAEVLLVLVPFTKLSHIVLNLLSRAQIGMDFGIKRGGMKGKGISW